MNRTKFKMDTKRLDASTIKLINEIVQIRNQQCTLNGRIMNLIIETDNHYPGTFDDVDEMEATIQNCFGTMDLEVFTPIIRDLAFYLEQN